MFFLVFNYATYQGISRNLLQLVSIEDKIAVDNPVRFIDVFFLAKTPIPAKVNFIGRGKYAEK
jgi:hypothetical protein